MVVNYVEVKSSIVDGSMTERIRHAAAAARKVVCRLPWVYVVTPAVDQ